MSYCRGRIVTPIIHHNRKHGGKLPPSPRRGLIAARISIGLASTNRHVCPGMYCSAPGAFNSTRGHSLPVRSRRRPPPGANRHQLGKNPTHAQACLRGYKSHSSKECSQVSTRSPTPTCSVTDTSRCHDKASCFPEFHPVNPWIPWERSRAPLGFLVWAFSAFRELH